MVFRSRWRWLVAALPATIVCAQQAAPPDARSPGQWVERLAQQPSRDVARELTGLGGEALPVLHRALVDRRPDVVRWALYTAASLPADVESLRDPIRRLMNHADLGIAIAAAAAWPALDGRGHTLVADYPASVIVDIAPDGERREVFSTPIVMQLAVLPDRHLLVCAYSGNRVIELDAERNEVWVFDDVKQPISVQRLPGGNTPASHRSCRRSCLRLPQLRAVIRYVLGSALRFVIG